MVGEMNPVLQTLRISLPQPVTVDRSRIPALVHKQIPGNVLLTDIRSAGSNSFFCTGRVPSDHPLFNGEGKNPEENILFYTEVGRQASLAMTHLHLHAGLDDAFIFERSEAALTEATWRLPLEVRAESIEIEIHVQETNRRKNGDVCRVIADHAMFLGGEQVFRGTGAWTIQPPAIYKRLRRVEIETSAADPGRPCRAAAELPHQLRMVGSGIVIREPEFRDQQSEAFAELVVDREHPFFFDHPCDHVPGMLLLEGCAQLALQMAARGGALSGRVMIAAYEINFGRFVEFGLPTMLTARASVGRGTQMRAPLQTYDIAVSQRGVASGVASITVGSSG
jgi:3-hydroxymyristoyl/3-hydroxydecanoyl-(acyl carrier protein) dehydratase